MNTFPLHEAVKRDDLDTAEQLIIGGADINGRDDKGRTPLYYAFLAMNEKLISLLITNGADINTVDNKGFTPFLEILENQKEDMNFLVEKARERLSMERRGKGKRADEVIDL